MIRREHQEERLGVDPVALGARESGERGHGNCRRGVAAGRLEQDRERPDADLIELLSHQETVSLVADDDRRRGARDARRPQGGLLDHRALADERQELLRVHLPRQRPEPRAGAARQDDGYQHC